MTKLEGIRARARAYAEHGTPGLAAPTDRKALLDWLDDVLGMCDQALSVTVEGSSEGDAAIAGFAAAMKRKLECK